MADLLAYASLMWDNALATYEGEKVGVDALCRGWVGASTKRWGTPERPCPQFGLLLGEGCEAVMFRIPRRTRRQLFHSLRQREGAKPQAVIVRRPEGQKHRVHSFLPQSSARTWPDAEATIEALQRAHGVVGTGAEYVRALIHAMELWGIEDAFVWRIWEQIRS
jgi:cation transport regulator ChaC